MVDFSFSHILIGICLFFSLMIIDLLVVIGASEIDKSNMMLQDKNLVNNFIDTWLILSFIFVFYFILFTKFNNPFRKKDVLLK